MRYFDEEEKEMEYSEESFFDCDECLEEDCTDCGEFENDIPPMEYDEYEIED